MHKNKIVSSLNLRRKDERPPDEPNLVEVNEVDKRSEFHSPTKEVDQPAAETSPYNWSPTNPCTQPCVQVGWHHSPRFIRRKNQQSPQSETPKRKNHFFNRETKQEVPLAAKDEVMDDINSFGALMRSEKRETLLRAEKTTTALTATVPMRPQSSPKDKSSFSRSISEEVSVRSPESVSKRPGFTHRSRSSPSLPRNASSKLQVKMKTLARNSDPLVFPEDDDVFDDIFSNGTPKNQNHDSHATNTFSVPGGENPTSSNEYKLFKSKNVSDAALMKQAPSEKVSFFNIESRGSTSVSSGALKRPASALVNSSTTFPNRRDLHPGTQKENIGSNQGSQTSNGSGKKTYTKEEIWRKQQEALKKREARLKKTLRQ